MTGCIEIHQFSRRTRLVFTLLLFISGLYLILTSQLSTIKLITANIHYKSPTYFITIPQFQNSSSAESQWLTSSTEKVMRSSQRPTVAFRETKDRFRLIPNCTIRNTGVEDILCMERPDFLPEFHNPCWYQDNRLRCLPYFHIIGVCKSGTSDLFQRITQHPRVLKNSGILNKELWFWTWRRYGQESHHFHRRTVSKMSLDMFVDSFNAAGIQRIKYTNLNYTGTYLYPAITGHGDPMDFWDQATWKMIPQNDPDLLLPEVTTPDLIKHVNPEVKLILMLRDPIERLFSHYLHGKFGTSSAQFHNDVISALDIIQSCNRTLTLKACLYSEDILAKLKVPISASFYSVHLSEWLRVFPRKQMLILRTEDFSHNIPKSLLEIFRFLRLDPIPTKELYRISNMPHFYYTKQKQYAGTIFPETIKLLQPVFEPYNRQLATMLNDTRFLWTS